TAPTPGVPRQPAATPHQVAAPRPSPQAVNVSTPPENCEANDGSDRVAGPLATPPLVVNCDPRHGPTHCVPEKPVMVRDSCVQMAESTLKVSCAVCATRKVPSE